MSKPIIPMVSPESVVVTAEGRCHALCSFHSRVPNTRAFKTTSDLNTMPPASGIRHLLTTTCACALW